MRVRGKDLSFALQVERVDQLRVVDMTLNSLTKCLLSRLYFRKLGSCASNV